MDCRSVSRFSTEHASITFGVLIASCSTAATDQGGREGRESRMNVSRGATLSALCGHRGWKGTGRATAAGWGCLS